MNCHIRILRVEKGVKSYRTFKETDGVKDIDNEINEISLLNRVLFINETACSTSYVPVPKVGKLPRHLTKSTAFPSNCIRGFPLTHAPTKRETRRTILMLCSQPQSFIYFTSLRP